MKATKTINIKHFHETLQTVTESIMVTERLLINESLLALGYDVTDGIGDSCPLHLPELMEIREELRSTLTFLTIGIPTTAKVTYKSPTPGLFTFYFHY